MIDSTFVEHPAHAPLLRFFVRCIPPLLKSNDPNVVVSIIDGVRLLRPHLDLRKFQALHHYANAEYSEALQIFEQIIGPESLAFSALCLRHIGEPSWWGVAQEVLESGDELAIGILDPWDRINEINASAPQDDAPNPLVRPLRA